METCQNIKKFFLSAILIGAGLISPSNGLDDRTYKTPLESLTLMAAAVFFGVIVYAVWSFLDNRTETNEPI